MTVYCIVKPLSEEIPVELYINVRDAYNRLTELQAIDPEGARIHATDL